jgi:hypothetical protein
METTEVDKMERMTPDDRGRVYLGSEFANTEVKVYVERVEE